MAKFISERILNRPLTPQKELLVFLLQARKENMNFSPQFFAINCLAFLTLSASSAVFYVNVNNTSPSTPYTNWITAATNIQDAIDASTNGDLILVTNGLYNTGGRVVYGSLTNRVAITKSVAVQSMNGPAATVIQGYPVVGSNAVRCVYLTTNAVISGFTLTQGATLNSGDPNQEQSGGGLFCWTNSMATNCILANNSAYYYGGGAFGDGGGNLAGCSLIQNKNTAAVQGGGGGAFGVNVTGSLLLSNVSEYEGGGANACVLTNCIIMQNNSFFQGGGAYSCLLYDCLVISNYSIADGGVYCGSSSKALNCTIIANNAYNGAGGIDSLPSSVVRNCIIYYNTVTTGSYSNYLFDGPSFQNCCTAPQVSSSSTCITNEPGFVDYANGNYRLNSNSPCINGGSTYPNGGSTFPPSATDFDGNPRVVDEIVDIGAYEYQVAGSILPTYWTQQYGLSKDGTIDSDGDGMNNFQEYIAGTNPTNAASVLKMLSVINNVSGATVKWQCVQFKLYNLQRSTNLPTFTTISTNLAGPTFPLGATTASFTDTGAVGPGPFFYRVSVQQ
jgi:Bacterial TSP3 repeat